MGLDQKPVIATIAATATATPTQMRRIVVRPSRGRVGVPMEIWVRRVIGREAEEVMGDSSRRRTKESGGEVAWGGGSPDSGDGRGCHGPHHGLWGRPDQHRSGIGESPRGEPGAAPRKPRVLISRAMGASRDGTPALRGLPKIDRLLGDARLAGFRRTLGDGLVTREVRQAVEAERARLRQGNGRTAGPELAERVLARVVESLERDGPPLPRVINATGVILHSGLGRAPLAVSAVSALRVAGGYSLLEVDRELGERRRRDQRAAELLAGLTGAEDAFVVNNNAGATLLILSALAAGREVVCSRGELVEIGGSYRIPDVMAASGCELREVGTTNRTHLADYESAITERTAALLAVHTSNYRIVGFTAAPRLAELVALGRARGIPVIHDLGSGSFLSPAELGVGDEPPARASLDAGADVVCMSGDKLLGGPQAGIILGRRDLLERMRSHPLARALRIDKLRVAALEATLHLVLDPARARAEIPVLRMIAVPVAELEPRAEALAHGLRDLRLRGVAVEVRPSSAEAGGGALPATPIPSLAVDLRGGPRPDRLARALRFQAPGVFARIVEDAVRFDLRTILPGEEAELPPLVGRAVAQAEAEGPDGARGRDRGV
jgi:L-seryl-tRNA(Ser) seleniumtransferase